MTYPGFGGTSAVSVNAINPLATSGTVDETSVAAGTNNAPNSGSIMIHTNTGILLGAVAYRGPAMLTPEDGFTTVGAVVYSTGLTRITLAPEYQMISRAGDFTAGRSLSQNAIWHTGIVSYSG